ncbi:unnamed protein product [Prorocentrum cordatum]|uniref:Uncharacterized protein n=1 Tax=Prorocentrum cordatum TaxID=2364126 RepID=A0ABN9XWW5_9DINO|nr:unnamed protein product [Polarella glacialis]
MCRGGLLLLAAAAQCAAAPGAGDLASGGAARSEAEAEGQQECEHAAMRLQALQTRSSLAGARSHEDPEPEAADPGPKPLGPADLDMRELTGYAEGNPYVPGPNVYLKEMVDPSNYWGYCLDIAGSPPKPLCESVQGHSCKTEGEDTSSHMISRSMRFVRSTSTMSATRCIAGTTASGFGRPPSTTPSRLASRSTGTLWRAPP